MNGHKNFMQKAIAVAKESGEKYGHRIGAILVKDGQVVATAPSVDNNFHAESNVIHLTLKKFSLTQLTGFTLYTTQEPCSMCLGVMLYANVDKVVFGAYAGDLSKTNAYEYTNYSVEELAKKAKKFDGGKLKIIGGVLQEECKSLLDDHIYWTVK